jgi:Protein of unknown function (DUF2971).
MIYKYSSIKSAIAIVKSGAVLLRSPLDFNDPFDSAFCFDEKDRRKAFSLVYNGSILEYVFNSVGNGDIPLSGRQRKIFYFEKKALLACLRKDPHYSPIPFFNTYVSAVMERNEETKDVVEGAYHQFCEIIERNLKKAQSDILISCFSKRNDSILMWSHYADSHRGVCLEFPEPADSEFRTVRYSSKKLFFGLSNIASLYVGSRLLGESLRAVDSEITAKASDPFFQKSKEWSYEEEVRCVFTETSNKKGLYFEHSNFYLQMPKIFKVYLGCRASGSDLRILKRLLQNRNIPFVPMKESESEYRIILK